MSLAPSKPSQDPAEPTATTPAEHATALPRPTGRTALRELERMQFDALEAANLRDLDT